MEKEVNLFTYYSTYGKKSDLTHPFCVHKNALFPNQDILRFIVLLSENPLTERHHLFLQRFDTKTYSWVRQTISTNHSRGKGTSSKSTLLLESLSFIKNMKLWCEVLQTHLSMFEVELSSLYQCLCKRIGGSPTLVSRWSRLPLSQTHHHLNLDGEV